MTGAETLWESALSVALRAGGLSVPAAGAIRRGLAPVADRAPAANLLAECEHLIGRVPSITLDELRREARTARDRLDAAGIARREQQRRDHRYLKRWVRDDGMYQGSFLLDPESGQLVFSALDAIIVSRPGVRFVDAAAQAAAQAVIDDPRTNDQLLADALVDMVRLATNADTVISTDPVRPATPPDTASSKVTHNRARAKPLIATSATPESSESSSIASMRSSTSAEPNACSPNCSASRSPCEMVGASSPPARSRHHHTRVHDNQWQITRDHATYWLKPPRSVEADQAPRLLRSKTRLVTELARHRD